MKPIIRLSSKRHLDILALLLYYNDQKKEIPNLQDRCKLIFDYDTRILIRNKLDISDSVLNNALVIFRKKGIIKTHNIIDEKYLIYPNESYEVSFKFQLDEGKRSNT